jgi:hypothetical protein
MSSILMKGVIRNGQVEVAEPINLPDGSEVTITNHAHDKSPGPPNNDGADDLEDKGFLEYCRTEGDPNITLDEVRAALTAIPGSMTAACSAERDED